MFERCAPIQNSNNNLSLHLSNEIAVNMGPNAALNNGHTMISIHTYRHGLCERKGRAK